VNAKRKKAMADRVIAACGGSVAGKTIGILGLAFKPNTDDMRDAPSLDIVPALIAAGAKIKAFDPEAMKEAKKLLDGIEYCDGAYDALEGADAMVVLTEWNEFRGMDLERVKNALVNPIVVDLRNVYDPIEMAESGFSYSCVGRATVGV
jgi:UDPglucose 6-dehydrogenase